MADDVPGQRAPNGIVPIRAVQQALETIHLGKKKQVLIINTERFLLDGVNAQYIVDFLRRNPKAVATLKIYCRHFSSEAVEVFRSFIATTHILQAVNLRDLGIANCVMLLSSLHSNTSVKNLTLRYDSLRGVHEGDVCGALFLRYCYATRI